MIKIVGVGDIMPGGLLTDSPDPCANEDIIKMLLDGDVRCGTLECAFGNEPTYDEAKVADRGNVIYAKDADIRRLKELHIDVVSLANNHFFDLGPDGAQHTIDLLDREGILHCGAGRNLEEAGKPVVLEIQGKKVAFLGFCDTDYNHVYWCTYATGDSPGVNPMRGDYVISEIKEYSSQYDFVIVLAHWGSENTFFPCVSIIDMAKKMIDAGASLVLGSHPHCVQSVIEYKGKVIALSLGNFLFPERLIAPPKVTYYPQESIDYSILPVTDEYPLVNTITLKTLPYLARVGMIVWIDGFAKVKMRFSYLSKNNRIAPLDAENERKLIGKINKIDMFIRLGVYPLYYKCCRYSAAAISKIKRLIKI